MKEPLILPYRGKVPSIHPDAFIAPSASVIGDVKIGKDSSIWFSTVIRGDENSIVIGEKTNIQDCCVVHGTLNKFSTTIGSFVTIGHGAVIHGCWIGDRVLIGMGARLLDGSKVSSESMVAAGTVVPEGFEVPPRTLVMGVPAKIKRGLRDDEIEWLISYAENYATVRLNYMGREKEAKF